VLNKITPEKFDRLMEQLLVRISCFLLGHCWLTQSRTWASAQLWRSRRPSPSSLTRHGAHSPLARLLSYPRAQAIWEPTFCPLYAEMCVGLSKALPEFPPVDGEDKPLTFRRVLLNTCQARGVALREAAGVA